LKTGRLSLIVLVIALAALSLAAWPTSSGASPALSDIGASWAREHIETLAALGVVQGYPDGTFRPDQPVTRAEFAKMAAAAFSLAPAGGAPPSGADGHWAARELQALAGAAAARPGETFQPDEPITRAEAVSLLVRLLRLDDVKGYSDQPAFSDLGPDHWAFDAAQTALRLKVLPPYFRGRFEPAALLTRAESAALLAESLRLITARGVIDHLEPDVNVVGVRLDDGTTRDFALHPDTVIHRNTAVAPFANLQVGDAVYVVADRYGSPQFVKANGVITPSDVVTKVSNATRGLLTPSDLRAIIAGDWKAVTESLRSTLYDQLVARGLDPVEAAAVITQDWESLRGYARQHVAQAVAEYLGISPDLAMALLERDWPRARELAQIEAVEQLLGGLLLEESA